jgi:hypothetical protein
MPAESLVATYVCMNSCSCSGPGKANARRKHRAKPHSSFAPEPAHGTRPPSHGGAATVTGCLCDGNSRCKQPGADCLRTGSPQGQRVWHFGAAQREAGCRRADGPIEPSTRTSSPTPVCLCAGIRSIFANEARKHTNHNSRVYFLWSLTPELTGAGGRKAAGHQHWPIKWRSHGQCWRPR